MSDLIEVGDKVSWMYHGRRRFGRVSRVHGPARVYMCMVDGKLTAVPASAITKECD